MDTQFFPHFIRANYKGFQIENKEAIEIGNMFKIYLEEILKDKQELLTKISNINPIEVIKKIGHPLKINGYEPVLLAHFDQFIKQEQSKMQDV